MLTRVERVLTGSTSSGVDETEISTLDTFADARLASSCVCIRESVSGVAASAVSSSSTCATPSTIGTDGRASETSSGNAVRTDAASHGLGPPSTSASAMWVAAFTAGNHRTSGTRKSHVVSKYISE